MTRLGFAARALIYFLIGYFALRTGSAKDGTAILRDLDGSAGGWLLGLMAVGLLGYGLWRISEAIADTEAHGSDAKGVAVRLGGVASGITHLFLCYLAVRLALSEGAGSNSGAREGADTVLSLPGGHIILVAVAAALAATGAYQLVKAVRADFLVHLEQRATSQPWVLWLGRAGYAARGVIFLVMGWFFWRASQQGDSSQVADMGMALGALDGPLRTAVAGGLLLFGIFSAVEAIYRRIHDPDLLRTLRSRIS